MTYAHDNAPCTRLQRWFLHLFSTSAYEWLIGFSSEWARLFYYSDTIQESKKHLFEEFLARTRARGGRQLNLGWDAALEWKSPLAEVVAGKCNKNSPWINQYYVYTAHAWPMKIWNGRIRRLASAGFSFGGVDLTFQRQWRPSSGPCAKCPGQSPTLRWICCTWRSRGAYRWGPQCWSRWSRTRCWPEQRPTWILA